MVVMPSIPKWIAATLAAAQIFTTSPPASAGEDYYKGLPPSAAGWYLPMGVTGGVVVHGHGPAGALLGAEVSVVHLSDEKLIWLGGYVDGVYDTARSVGRFSVGPELGWTFFGIDGGLLAQVGGARVDPGVVVRPVVTIGWLGLYARYGHVFSGDALEDFGDVGLLLKYPLEVHED
jgi:hypothetical protein